MHVLQQVSVAGEVGVAMEDGLPRDLAVIHANVEPLHARVFLLDRLSVLLEEPVTGVELRPPQLKEAPYAVGSPECVEA